MGKFVLIVSGLFVVDIILLLGLPMTIMPVTLENLSWQGHVVSLGWEFVGAGLTLVAGKFFGL